MIPALSVDEVETCVSSQIINFSDFICISLNNQPVVNLHTKKAKIKWLLPSASKFDGSVEILGFIECSAVTQLLFRGQQYSLVEYFVLPILQFMFQSILFMGQILNGTQRIQSGGPPSQ